jgi:hypothetical protein
MTRLDASAASTFAFARNAAIAALRCSDVVLRSFR